VRIVPDNPASRLVDFYTGAKVTFQVRRLDGNGLPIAPATAQPIEINPKANGSGVALTLPARANAPAVAQTRLNVVTGAITGVNAKQEYMVVDTADIGHALAMLSDVGGYYSLARAGLVAKGWTPVAGSSITVKEEWKTLANPQLVVRVAATATAPASNVRNWNAKTGEYAYPSTINLKNVIPATVFTDSVDPDTLVAALFSFNANTGVLTANGAKAAILGYATNTLPEVSVNGKEWATAKAAGNLRPYLDGTGEIWVRLQGYAGTKAIPAKAPSEAIRIKIVNGAVTYVP
jgi:plasmid maintenance system antidote protein VapI